MTRTRPTDESLNQAVEDDTDPDAFGGLVSQQSGEFHPQVVCQVLVVVEVQRFDVESSLGGFDDLPEGLVSILVGDQQAHLTSGVLMGVRISVQ